MLRASLRVFSRWGHRVALTLLALSVCLYLNTLWQYLEVYRNEGTSYLPCEQFTTIYIAMYIHVYVIRIFYIFEITTLPSERKTLIATSEKLVYIEP